MMLGVWGILVWFWLSTLSWGKDLKPRCGAIFSDKSSGWFTPPVREIDPSKDIEVYKCLWIIKNTGKKLIKFQLTDMMLETHPQCKLARVMIEDDRRVLGTFCEYTSSLPPIFARTEFLYVISLSTNDFPLYFNASFVLVDASKETCGGQVKSTAGWITAPDLDSDLYYDYNLDCVWVIGVSLQNVLILHFLYFDVEFNVECGNGDFLTIQADSKLLGRYCGSSLPPLITTTAGRVNLRFRTDHTEPGKGFNATFVQEKGSTLNCGGILNGSSGKINIPEDQHRGGSQPNVSRECLWILYGDEHKKIQLTIKALDNTLLNNTNESLQIYDDFTTYFDYPGEYPLPMFPLPSIVSRLNILFIRWTHSKTLIGFNATYSQIYEFNLGCGGVLNETTGHLVYPTNLQPNNDSILVDCFWVIEAPANMTVVVKVAYQIPGESTLCKDFLQITDGKSLNNNLCGSTYDSNYGLHTYRYFASQYNSLYIRFHLVESKTNDWVSLDYYRKPKPVETCGDTMNSTTGSFKTPNLVDPDGMVFKTYGFHEDCLWVLKGQEKSVILLSFLYFVLESSQKCKLDFVEIYDLAGVYERRCGTLYEPQDLIIQSKANVLNVHFVSDGAMNFKGFLASYEEITGTASTCNREVNATAGFLTPVFVPGFLGADECAFIITAVPGNIITLNPFVLNISLTETCYTEFIEIQSTGKLCGYQRIGRFTSKSNMLKYEYKVLPSRRYHGGFNVSYIQAKDKRKQCGSMLTNPIGELIYYRDAGDFPYQCLWTILAATNQVIMFQHSTQWLDYIGVSIEVKEMHKTYDILEELRKIYSSGDMWYTAVTEYRELYIQLQADEWEPTYWLLKNASDFKYTITEESYFCSDVYKCILSNISVPRNRLCDNVRDCPAGDDERFCGYGCPENCTCVRLSIYGPGNTDDCTELVHTNNFLREDMKDKNEEYAYQMSGIYHARQIDVSGNSDVFQNIEFLFNLFSSALTTYLEVLNISSCRISKLSARLFRYTLFLTELDISFNYIEILTAGLFRPLTRLHTLLLKGNYAILNVETASFAGLSSLKHLELSHLHFGQISEYAFAGVSVNEFSIAYSTIESMDSNSFGHLMTSVMNLKTSKIEHFSKLIFKDLLNVSLLITSSFQFCCIRPYYLSKNKCLPQRTALSSCSDLIGNENGRYFLWISAIFIIVSNILSIISKLDLRMFKSTLGHRFFVCNLSLSDLLFGVYLCIIITLDMFSRGEYASFEHSWRESKTCLLATILSSTTVLVRPCLLLLISCARVIVIAYPSGQFQITRTLALASVALIWSVMLAVAVFFTFMNEPLTPTGLCIGFPLKYDSSPLKYDSSPEWLVKVTLLLAANVITLVLCFNGFRGITSERKGEISREKSGTLRNKDGSSREKGGTSREKGGSSREKGGSSREKSGKLRERGMASRGKGGTSREKAGTVREKSETSKKRKTFLKRSDDLKTSMNMLLLVTINALCTTLVFIAGLSGLILNDDKHVWITIVTAALLSTTSPVLFNLSSLFHIEGFLPDPEEQNRPILGTEEEFDQILSLISNPSYWWRKTKRTHFTSLTTLVNDGSLCVKDVAIITRGLAQLVEGLHSRELVQSYLESRDVYLHKRGGRILFVVFANSWPMLIVFFPLMAELQNKSQDVAITVETAVNVALKCRPMLMEKPSDYANNSSDLGRIVFEMMKNTDKDINFK